MLQKVKKMFRGVFLVELSLHSQTKLLATPLIIGAFWLGKLQIVVFI